jgi:trk system potassium uptake protein TrkA
MSSRVVVVGAGSTGRHIAGVLAGRHDVTLVDRQPADAPAGVRFLLGDATDPAVLLHAGAHGADALVCVTRDDPVNLLVALLAKRRFGVRWTVARTADPEHRWLFTPEAGVDVAVSAAEMTARLVQESLPR